MKPVLTVKFFLLDSALSFQKVLNIISIAVFEEAACFFNLIPALAPYFPGSWRDRNYNKLFFIQSTGYEQIQGACYNCGNTAPFHHFPLEHEVFCPKPVGQQGKHGIT